MARKLELKRLKSDDREYVEKHLRAVWGVDDEECLCYDIDGAYMYVPFAFGFRSFKGRRQDIPIRQRRRRRRNYNDDDDVNSTFVSELRKEQTQIVNAALKTLDDDGSTIVASATGFGKTVCAIKIIDELRVRTCIVVNRCLLIGQWRDAIRKHAPTLSVQVFCAKDGAAVLSADVIIVNAVNIGKRNRRFWSSVSFVIVDELHQIVTKKYTRNLLLFEPSYVLGLSATPYRMDDFHKVVAWIFGAKTHGRELHRSHLVEFARTDFKPVIRTMRNGQLDWNEVLNSQARDPKRNDLIVSLVCERLANRTWIILVKRVFHANELARLFTLRAVRCDVIVGSKVDFDRDARVLIGTTSKVGVGFDHAAIDSLCLAADVSNYFVQFLGRCMRRPEANPRVLDIVDDFTSLEAHFESRCDCYRKHGGELKEVTISHF